MRFDGRLPADLVADEKVCAELMTEQGSAQALTRMTQWEFDFRGIRISALSSLAEGNDSVIIVQGIAETWWKYLPLILELNSRGISVYTFDLPSQGRSGRFNRDHDRIYIRSMSDYTECLKTFVSSLHLESYSVISNSCGGLISLSSGILKNAAHAVFVAPMLKPVLPLEAAAPFVAQTVAFFIRLLHLRPIYCPGNGGYKKVVFWDNIRTHSEKRYELYQAFYQRNRAAAVGGVTWPWLASVLSAKPVASPCPSLFIIPGDDQVVRSDLTRRFATSCPAASVMEIPGAYHDILNEADSYRLPAVGRIFSFLLDMQPIGR